MLSFLGTHIQVLGMLKEARVIKGLKHICHNCVVTGNIIYKYNYTCMNTCSRYKYNVSWYMDKANLNLLGYWYFVNTIIKLYTCVMFVGLDIQNIFLSKLMTAQSYSSLVIRKLDMWMQCICKSNRIVNTLFINSFFGVYALSL